MSELLEGLFRSPRFIQRANGPHEVRYVPPRLFARCGLAWDKARLGAPGLWAGEKSGLFEHPEAILYRHHYAIFQRCIVYKLSFSTAC